MLGLHSQQMALCWRSICIDQHPGQVQEEGRNYLTPPYYLLKTLFEVGAESDHFLSLLLCQSHLRDCIMPHTRIYLIYFADQIQKEFFSSSTLSSISLSTWSTPSVSVVTANEKSVSNTRLYSSWLILVFSRWTTYARYIIEYTLKTCTL